MTKVLAVDQTALRARDRCLYRVLSTQGGMDITLLVPRLWQDEFGSSRPEPERSQLSVICGRVVFPGKSHRAFYPILPRLLRALRPSILYLNAEPESYLAWHAVRSRKRCSPGTRIVFISWRNIDYPDGSFPYKFARLNARAERAVLSNADHCIAHNRSAKEILVAKGFRNVTVIPPGVDTELFKQASGDALRESLGLKTFTIGYVGRLITDKGVDLLLRAAGTLTFPFQLLIVGGGPELSELRAIARSLGIGDRLVWAGSVRHDEVPAYLNAMDILVLPSRTGKAWKEQFGRVLIEAMSCCVPVIGSRSGEIPHVIGDAGLLFHEGSVSELADALRRAHGDSNMTREMARRGVERVLDHFDVKRVAERYRDLFLSLKSPE